jgi:hypothetical protein
MPMFDANIGINCHLGAGKMGSHSLVDQLGPAEATTADP